MSNAATQPAPVEYPIVELAQHLKPIVHCARPDNATRTMCGDHKANAMASGKIVKPAADFADCFYYRCCQRCVATVAKKAAKAARAK